MPVYSIRLPRPLIGAQLQGTHQRAAAGPRVADQAAMQQELKMLSKTMRAVDQRMSEQHAAVQELISGLRRDVADLATAIATQVIGEQASTPQRVQELVEGMLNEVDVGDSPQVYLHPADHLLLQQVSPAKREFDAHQDAAVERGSCRIEGPRNGFLRHWKHQVAAIRKSVLEQLGD